MTPVALIEPVFPLHHHPEPLVVQDHAFGRDPFHVGESQFLDVHQEGTVSVDVDHLAVRKRHLGADGRRVPVPHRAQPGRGEERAWLVEVVELAGPHLVLAHTRGDDRVAFGQLVQKPDRVLRLNHIFRVVEREGEPLLPLVDLVVPCRERLVLARGAPDARLFKEHVQTGQRILHIAQDRQFDDLVLVDLGVVDVDVDNRPVLRKLADLAGHTVVKPHPDGQ